MGAPTAAPATPLWGKRGGVLPHRTRICSIYPTGEVSPARRARVPPPRSAWEPPFTMRSKVFQLPGSGHVRNQLTRSQSSFSQASIFADMHSAQKTLCYGPRVHRESPLPEPTRSATGRSLAIFGRPARSPGARPLHTQPVTAPPTSVGVRSHATSRDSWKLPAAYQSRAATLRAFYHLHAATLRVFTR
jgi:hypothetical protein